MPKAGEMRSRNQPVQGKVLGAWICAVAMHITPVGAGFSERLHLLVTPRLIGWFDVGVVNDPRTPRTPRFLFSPRVCGALPHPLPLVFAKDLWGAAPPPAREQVLLVP